jgi:hypothetical protein
LKKQSENKKTILELNCKQKVKTVLNLVNHRLSKEGKRNRGYWTFDNGLGGRDLRFLNPSSNTSTNMDHSISNNYP